MMRNYKIIPEQYSDYKISHADGVYVFDKYRKYIDLSGGAGMCSLGYNNKDLNEVAKKQLKKLMLVPSKYKTEEREKLAIKILSLFPKQFDAVVPTVTGSETIETAMQIAIEKTKANNFLSFKNAYHGRTFGAGSLGDKNNWHGFLGNNFDSIEAPYNIHDTHKTLKIIEIKFHKKKFAAFFVEGVITNTGYVMPPSQFYQKLFDLCRKKCVLLIFDEVLTGFGRTGKMFSFKHHKIIPDIVCISKAMAAGYVAMGAVVTKRNLVKNYDLSSAFTWPPFGCAISLKNIEIILHNKLSEKSKKLGEIALTFLKKKLDKCPMIKNINGVGLGIGIKFLNKEEAFLVYKKCLEMNVILFRKLDVNLLAITPPLNIKEKELIIALKKVVLSIVNIYEHKNK